MARYSKDRGARSISIGPTLPVTSPKENANTAPANNGTTTGPGDEFIYVPSGPGGGYQFPQNMSWDVSVSGGTFSAMTVVLQGSDDGLNWATIDTMTAAGAQAVSNPGFLMYRENVLAPLTVSSGMPVITGGISL